MGDLELRLLLTQPSVRKRIQELMPTDGEMELMLGIAIGEDTSSKVAVANDLSIQAASGRLSTLWRKGYIARQLVPQESGGYEYVYRNLFKIGDRNDER